MSTQRRTPMLARLDRLHRLAAVLLSASTHRVQTVLHCRTEVHPAHLLLKGTVLVVASCQDPDADLQASNTSLPTAVRPHPFPTSTTEACEDPRRRHLLQWRRLAAVALVARQAWRVLTRIHGILATLHATTTLTLHLMRISAMAWIHTADQCRLSNASARVNGAVAVRRRRLALRLTACTCVSEKKPRDMATDKGRSRETSRHLEHTIAEVPPTHHHMDTADLLRRRRLATKS